MSFIHLAWYLLWISSHTLLAAVVILLVRRGLSRQFPAFLTYAAFGLCKFMLLIVLSTSLFSPVTYFRSFSVGLAVSTALRFGIIAELFTHVFQKYASLRHLERPAFRWTMAGFLALAFCFAVYTHRGDVDPTWFAVYVLDRSTSLVQCGLLLCLFALTAVLHIRWKGPVFGIALGLAIFLSVNVALAAIRSQVGHGWRHPLDLVSMGTYLCSVLIWLIFLWLPEPRPAYTEEGLPEQDLEAWNQEMQRLLHRP